MLVASWFLGGFLYYLVCSCLFKKFVLNQKFKITRKTIVVSLLLGFWYLVITRLDLIYIRPYFIQTFVYLGLLYEYRQKVIKSLIAFICVLIITFLSEFIFGMFLVLILKINVMDFEQSWYGYTIINTLISIISLLLSKISYINKIINNIIQWYNKNEYKSFIFCVILAMIIFTFLLYNNFIKLLPNSILWILNLFCVSVIFFVINYFKEKANNNRIINEYDQLLDYVKKYEKIVDEKSKNQHEYRNQLILIKGMINKSNKNAIDYIDSIYNEEKNDDDIEVLKKLQYLPSGGLKGLIYYKIEDMLDKKINVFVNISPKIQNTKLNKQIDKNLKDVSRIIGVYLDNAIEATLNTKEKYIIFESYLDNDELVFSISNTYDGNINLNIIDKEGYTTKGSGKGYGLSLVKDIIFHNNEIRQSRELNGIYYVQKLYIKK